MNLWYYFSLMLFVWKYLLNLYLIIIKDLYFSICICIFKNIYLKVIKLFDMIYFLGYIYWFVYVDNVF